MCEVNPEDIQAYRDEILKALMDYRGEDGFPVLMESDAIKLLSQLNDAELADGYLFNTPQEVAELLIEEM